MSDFKYEDCFNMICGNKLGGGVSRTVFDSPLNSDWVIKVETGTKFQNIFEFETWRNFSYSDCEEIAVWLAPCYFMSPEGKVLIQQKCEPIPKSMLPKKVPTFLTDLKQENWGLLNGNPVCIDYGFVIPELNVKLKKANWDE